MVETVAPFTAIFGGGFRITSITRSGQNLTFKFPTVAGYHYTLWHTSSLNAVWVDTDGCVSAANYCPVIISSVNKAMDVAVLDVIKAAKDGSFSNEPFIGTLENDGTGLTPFHEFDSKVPAELKSELDALKADIISGKIKIESGSQPT